MSAEFERKPQPSPDAQPSLLDPAEEESRFKLLVGAVSDYAIFMLNPDGYILSWNAGAERIKGYSAEEAIGKHFSIFYTQFDRDRRHPQRELEIAISEGRFEEEGWRVKKDGSQFWANVVITRLTDPSGKLVGFAKVTRDLTLRRQAEEQLRANEERYRLLVSAVKDYAIFMLDAEGRVATWNEGAQHLKGYQPEETIGQHFSLFYPAEDIRTGKPAWELEEAALTGRFEDEGWRMRKDGTRFWANVILTAIRNPAGKLLGFSKVTRDITDRRRLEEKLRRANEDLDMRVQERTLQLEKAIRARDEFISIISHELRTPVTSMKLQVQTALRRMTREDAQTFHDRAVKFAKGAGRQLDRLAKLIDDMLDVSRLSIDQMQIKVESVDLAQIVRESVERNEEQAEQAGAPIHFEAPESLTVSADPFRLEQVITNLIINAVKYGSAKPISVRVGRSDNQAFIAIADQGLGIAPEDRERIFGRFERAISANSVSGMGLGLFISKKIVEAHGGQIALESEVGRGSLFTIWLPLMGGDQP